MIGNFAISLTENGADLGFVGEAVATDDGLRPIVLVALFTDANAPADEELPGDDPDRRGWWSNPNLGGLLWLVERAKVTTLTINRVREAAVDALAFLTELGIAETVEVFAARGLDSSQIDLTVQITQGSATRYSSLWEATSNYDLSHEGLNVSLLFR